MLKAAAALAFVLTMISAGFALAQGCPPNSHVASQSGGTYTCVCDQGYTYSNGACVR